MYLDMDTKVYPEMCQEVSQQAVCVRNEVSCVASADSYQTKTVAALILNTVYLPQISEAGFLYRSSSRLACASAIL